MCLYPRFYKNKKYLPTKKNGYNPPKPKDNRTLYVPVKCGKCEECRKALANEWKIRFAEEFEIEKERWDVTLTFSEESLMKLDAETPMKETEYRDNTIATEATRRFLERWRKKHTKSVKHWFITELGHESTERIHLHGIMFCSADKIKDLKEIWKYGHVDIGTYCNERTIGYCVKYITKVDNKHKDFMGKILNSAGIGANYMKREKHLNIYQGRETKDYYKTKEGYKLGLPIYYRNHLYTEEQREKLWMYKCDKKERYITGTKYKLETQEDIENFYKALAVAQEDNIKHGYGKIKWDENDHRKGLEEINLKEHKEKLEEKYEKTQKIANKMYSSHKFK